MAKPKKKSADAVGYCQPPKHSQFKKGKSGNPSGVPKNGKAFKPLGRIVRDFLQQELSISKEGRGRKKTTLIEAVLTVTGKSALQGNLPAAKFLVYLGQLHIPQRQSMEDLLGGRPVLEFTEEEAARFSWKELTKGMAPPNPGNDGNNTSSEVGDGTSEENADDEDRESKASTKPTI
jgi:hypothetical protein